MSNRDIIVVGASAGGVEALVTLARTLPRNLPAAVFVVLHIPAQSPSLMPEILSRSGPLKAIHAVDGMAIQHAQIYLAPPDHHLLVEQDRMRVVRGPKENRHRPAVDPLFRSVAHAYGPRVIGVILTGALDDGTAGLWAVKWRGGIAVVQDPKEALYPGMPQSALEHVKVDYVLPLAQIGPLLIRLASEEVKDEHAYPILEEMDQEVKIVEMSADEHNGDKRTGTPSAYSCPECGGVLWELHDGELLHFRCRVGHAFSTESMFAEQSDALEEALWSALKTLEESRSLSRRMEQQAQQRGQEWLARTFKQRAKEAEQRAMLLQRVLQKNETATTNTTVNEQQNE